MRVRVAEVIGTITLSRWHPSLQGARYVISVPFSLRALRAGGRGDGEDLVIYDALAAGAGDRIAFSEGVEAAAPFQPNKVPVDAYAAAIIDTISVTETA
jgi:ethanolamine utilization protein EutN